MKFTDLFSGEVSSDDAAGEFSSAQEFGKLAVSRSFIFEKKFMKAGFIPISSVKQVFQRVRPVSAGCCPPYTVEEQYFVAVYGDDMKELEIFVGENRHGDVEVKRALELFRNIEGIQIGFSRGK